MKSLASVYLNNFFYFGLKSAKKYNNVHDLKKRKKKDSLKKIVLIHYVNKTKQKKMFDQSHCLEQKI